MLLREHLRLQCAVPGSIGAQLDAVTTGVAGAAGAAQHAMVNAAAEVLRGWGEDTAVAEACRRALAQRVRAMPS